MLELLKERFMKNPSLHPGLVWEEVEESLKKNPDSLTILKKMEETGGEVNTIGKCLLSITEQNPTILSVVSDAIFSYKQRITNKTNHIYPY